MPKQSYVFTDQRVLACREIILALRFEQGSGDPVQLPTLVLGIDAAGGEAGPLESGMRRSGTKLAGTGPAAGKVTPE